MLSLLCFNADKNSILTFDQLATTTGVPRDALTSHVMSLANPKNKVLLKNPNNATLSAEDKFKVNDKYNNPARRVQVHYIPSKEEVKKSEDDADNEVENLRKFQYVVRCKKQKQKKQTRARLSPLCIGQA